jgi:hypothetical protein
MVSAVAHAGPPVPCQRVEEVVERVLSPYVGGTMARAATRGHYDKLGIAGPELDAGQLDALCGRIGLGLHIFVGRERTAELVAEIRRALGASGAVA